jgi:hypothetical protein
MKDAEFRFLVETFNTEWFNLHPTWEYPLRHPLSEYVRSKILIENSNFDVSLRGEDLSEFAGLCIDLSHLEDSRRTCQHVFNETLRLCGAYSVLANHISAVATSPTEIRNGLAAFSSHHSNRPEEFNYLHGMAAATIAPLCALELENSLAEQVSLIPFIQSVIAEHRAQRRSVA